VTTLRRTVDLAARRAAAARTEAVLRDVGAIRDGHVALADGTHAVVILEPERVVADPEATGILAELLVAPYRPEGSGDATIVDVVVGHGVAGAVLAYECARRLGVRAAAHPAGEDPGVAARHGAAALGPAVRALLVDAELAPDGGLLAAIPHVEATGAEIVGCAAIMDRTEGRAQVTSAVTWASYPFTALWRPELPAYSAGRASCPGCAAGTPLSGPRR
jgi:orotate phosphoribosyltransferase